MAIFSSNRGRRHIQINDIEPKFNELKQGIDGAMAQIGDLEKRIEQLQEFTPMESE